MNRSYWIHAFKNYKSVFPEEAEFAPRFLELLNEEDCFKRSNLKAHITGSAWVVSHDYSRVLLIHHKKLDKWLQPGGHADGNENILAVALKEAEEETGLREFEEVFEPVFDIDIHRIPERKLVPGHFHFDVRFLLRAKKDAVIAGNHESNAVKWVGINEIDRYAGGNRSIRRMVEKTKKFLA